MSSRIVSLRAPLLALLALLGSSLAPAPARANRAVVVGPTASVRDVRVGDTVELRWPGLPARARELELLLSVDGGAHFTLRASAEVDAGRGMVRWRVPALPTAHARLRVRWGDGRDERLLPPTAEFRILPGNAAPGAQAAAPAWDEDDPATAGPTSGVAASVRPGDASWDPGSPGEAAFVSSPGPDLRAPHARALPDLESQADPAASATPPPASSTHSPRAPRRE